MGRSYHGMRHLLLCIVLAALGRMTSTTAHLNFDISALAIFLRMPQTNATVATLTLGSSCWAGTVWNDL